MTKRIYLISCSGRPNYGDELITATWLTYLQHFHPDYEVWLDTPEPGNSQALFTAYHPGFKVINCLWKLSERNSCNVSDIINSTNRLIQNFGTPDIDSNLTIFKSADCVHILGGGYINSKWKENYTLLYACAALKKQHPQVKTFATGLSIYPHEDFLPTKELAAVIASFDYFSVRDQVSADKLGVPNHHDDVFLARKMDMIKVSDDLNTPDIMCCIQSELAEEGMFMKLIEEVGTHIQALRRNGMSIGYLEAIPGVDSQAYNYLKRLVPDLKLYPFTSVWNEGLPLRNCNKIISTRFHHHLVGAILGIPGVALNVDHDYYANKHGSLHFLTTGWGKEINELRAKNINEEFFNVSIEIGEAKFRQAHEMYQYKGKYIAKLLERMNDMFDWRLLK